MAPTATPDNAPNPSMVFDLLLAHQRTAALKAAIDLDLFRAVGETQGGVAELARHCRASERGIRILCDYLTINGVLTKAGGRYSHTPTSATFLDPRSPMSLASTAQFLSNPMLLEPYGRLAEVVRNGRTTLEGEGSVEPENPVWVQFAESMAPMMGPAAGPMAELASAGLSPAPSQILDIAAGHGLFGIAVAKLHPQARVSAVDWAPVLRVASENARRAGVADRFDTVPGSAFEVAYGGPHDIALLTNFLHHFDPATNIGLLKKVRAALRPGGRAAALEFVPNDDRVSPPMSAGFSLTMLASTATGDAYTFRQLREMFEGAGFSAISQHAIPTSPETVILATA